MYAIIHFVFSFVIFDESLTDLCYSCITPEQQDFSFQLQLKNKHGQRHGEVAVFSSYYENYKRYQ